MIIACLFWLWCRKDNMVFYQRKIKPVQGGFLVFRPDMNVYKEIVDIVKKGDFDKHGGWGNITRLFYGSMTIQGIVQVCRQIQGSLSSCSLDLTLPFLHQVYYLTTTMFCTRARL